MGTTIMKAITAALVAALVLIGCLWAALWIIKPKPDGRLVLATGAGSGSAAAYLKLAETYAKDLATHGVKVEIRQTGESFDTLKALTDDASGVHAGFVKGGLFGSLQGRLALGTDKAEHDGNAELLRSVGRLFHEPLWVFTRGDLPLETLRDLRGKRILVGTRQSGSRRIASQMMLANGISEQNATFIEQELADDAAAFMRGEADAAFLILPADSDKVQKLLRVADIRLMNFEAEALAYTSRFPALSRVVLHTGAVEFEPLVPSADITLLATSATMVVRADLHPALVSLLAHSVLHHPRSAFDKAGDPVLFHRSGEFPNVQDPEFEVHKDARLVFKTGELPFLLRGVTPLARRLGLSFGVPAMVNANGAKLILLLIPILTVLLPMLRIVPAVYNWTVRRRLLYWYQHLKALERRIEAMPEGDSVGQLDELERIDSGVRRIRVPLAFSDQFYDLRGHIDLVRRRLMPGARDFRVAAE